MVHQGVGGRGGRGEATGRDDGCAALADGGQEGLFQPSLVGDDGGSGLARDLGVLVVGEHRGGVVAEDRQVGDLRDGHAGLLGELGGAAVLIQTDHGSEALLGETLRLGGGDHDVGVAGVAHHGHAAVVSGNGVDDLALAHKDLAVVLEQVGALLAGTARLGAHQQTPVGVTEGDFGLVGQHHAGEQRKGAVLEFQGHATQSGLGLFHRDFQKLQDDRLVLAEHLARGNAEKQAVADLAGGTGDGDANGLLHLRVLAFFE